METHSWDFWPFFYDEKCASTRTEKRVEQRWKSKITTMADIWAKMDAEESAGFDGNRPRHDTDNASQTLVPAPRSFFMDVKCPGCFTITTVFSHAQTVVICQGCTTVLCQPTGGKARLTEGCSFRRK
ncbi:ribosomal protein S27-domain-containing protein [Neurospora hispaniola]|uniref:Ribosomal protein S27-domain-containing protein n=1 Tax=Neurospora hispaniola TaxID=588809 RepID=A0AAJ0IDE9_9PEZI|nr:ribosomal protein S27-domain-containing protein [Neurospora hispaniola]